MRKLYSLLACLFVGFNLLAQTTTAIDFSFAADPLTNNVTFTNTSVLSNDGIKRAYWYFGDNTQAVTAPAAGTQHHYNSAGTYQACLKIYKYNPNNSADSTLLGSVCKSITIQQVCSAGFQWADSITTNPFRHHIRFYGAGSNNANKQILQVCWNFGDGTDTCIQATAGALPPLNIVHSYQQGGSYNVCLKIKYDGGCVAEKCTVINLSSPPVIADTCSATFTVQPLSSVASLSRKFIAQPWHNQNKRVLKVCWNFGDGRDTCIQYPTSYTGSYFVEHNYIQPGTYSVCVTIFYDGGCDKRKCETVTIPPTTPTCSFDLNETTVAATNLERRFFVGLMQNATAEKVCWSFGDGTDTCIILSNPLNPQQLIVTHRYPAPGTYTVCAKVYYAGGCVVQKCRQITISIPYPSTCGGFVVDSVLSSNSIHFKGTSIHAPNDYALSYNWTFGDGTTAAGQVVNHTYTSPGRYNVCLVIRTNAGCETRICKPVSITGNVQPQLVLTPNPVVSVLNASFTSLLQQTMTIRIYNANGILVRSYTRMAIAGANNWSFSDVGTLPTGVYSVIVQSNNQLATAIFFKQ